MPPMQPEQKKKKKRITPELIAGPGAQAMGPQMGAPATVEAVKSKKQKTGSSTGYLRVKRAAEDQDDSCKACISPFHPSAIPLIALQRCWWWYHIK